MNTVQTSENRRHFVQIGLGIVIAGGLIGPAQAQGLIDKAEQTLGIKPEDVTPPEDLMRDHGVLDRLRGCHAQARVE
jgi:hypothetical protein